MDPTSNFGIYRSCLKAAMWRSEGAEAGSKEEKVRRIVKSTSYPMLVCYMCGDCD